jgi:hypothetical protein
LGALPWVGSKTATSSPMFALHAKPGLSEDLAAGRDDITDAFTGYANKRAYRWDLVLLCILWEGRLPGLVRYQAPVRYLRMGNDQDVVLADPQRMVLLAVNPELSLDRVGTPDDSVIYRLKSRTMLPQPFMAIGIAITDFIGRYNAKA